MDDNLFISGVSLKDANGNNLEITVVVGESRGLQGCSRPEHQGSPVA